ncbi:hypothetical protein VULLAG_LOCUS557 [Vulpes lagopus]
MGSRCSQPWPTPSSRCTGRLLKLPLEGLREFLQDSLAQPWALEDEAVLRHLRASMTQLRRMRCDLPHPGGT